MKLLDYLDTYQNPPDANFRANNAGALENHEAKLKEWLNPAKSLIETTSKKIKEENLPEWLAEISNAILGMALVDRFFVLAGRDPRKEHQDKTRNWHQIKEDPNPPAKDGFTFDERIAGIIAQAVPEKSNATDKLIQFIEHVMPECIRRGAAFKTEKSYKARSREFKAGDFKAEGVPGLKQPEDLSGIEASLRKAIGAPEKPEKLRTLVTKARGNPR